MREPFQAHVDCVGVSARLGTGLEQGDVRVFGEQPCRGQTRYAPADDGHARLASA